MDEWGKKMPHTHTHTHTHSELLFYHKKVRPVIYNNMDGTWEYYAKWDKSKWERKILYDTTYMWNLEKANSVTKSTVVVTRDWEWENWEDIVKEY